MEFSLYYVIFDRCMEWRPRDSLAAGGPFGTLGSLMNVWVDELHHADDQLALGIL